MRVVKIVGGMLVLLVLLVYVVLFTGVGNSILRPIVQNKASEALGMPVKLQKFRLGISALDVILYLGNENSVRVYGEYSPFAQSFDLKYDVKLLSLTDLQPLTRQQLAGSLKTQGSIRGDLDLINIDGVSDVAKSSTNYHIELTKFDVTSIKAKIKSLQVDALLQMLAQPKFARATLDLDLNFKNIKPHQLDGIVYMRTKEGGFNKTVIKKELGIAIPYTKFHMQAKAKLQKESIVYDYLFDSNLLKLTTRGSVIPQPLAVDIAYKASIKELALLRPLTNAPLRGRLNAQGTLKGKQEKMLLKLKSDLAASKTDLVLTLKELKPAALDLSVVHLRLEKLFYMLQQPHYASGDFNLKADIDDLRAGKLKGKVTSVTTGKLDNVYLTKEYKFKHPMPNTSFRLRTVSTLQGADIDTLATLASGLANVNLKQARFNVEKSTLKSDYKVAIPSLEKLYFVTDKHLRGGIEANGEIQKANSLRITAYSKIADGIMKMKLVDEKLHVDLEDVRTKRVLWILRYPEIFDGGMYAKTDYDLTSQKGVVTAKFKDGKFVKNDVFDALKQFGKVDLYKEYFNGDAKANIVKEKIAATFDLKSRKAEIRSYRTLLDTKHSTIDSQIELTVDKSPVTVTLKGDIAKPTVGVDLKAFMKSEAGKKLEKKADKELNRLFKKLF